MIRPNLAGIAPPVLPTGFSFRACRPGDEAAWLEIIRRGYGGPFPGSSAKAGRSATEDRDRAQCSFATEAGGDWPEDAFQRHVLADASFRPERLLFIAQDGGPCVATAGAFQNLFHGDRTGYVHMMAVLPEFRRRGLGTALLRRCLLYFREQGWRDAVLDTDVTRLPAIRLYLANRFEPFPEVEADVEKWRAVLAALGMSGLSATLKPGTPVR